MIVRVPLTITHFSLLFIVSKKSLNAIKHQVKRAAQRQTLFAFTLRKSLKLLGLTDYEDEIELQMHPRPHYGYCLLQSAKLAKKLGFSEISALEFGVAGGNGLIILEQHARIIEEITGVQIQIYGFDLSSGLPKPQDYRDLPYHFKQGHFQMNIEELRAKLTRSTLVIGDVKDTVLDFFSAYKPAKVGAIFFDLDFYSSTRDALEILNGDPNNFIPRVFCYFDDVVGGVKELYNDYTGERLAINEFNVENHSVKLGIPYYLRSQSNARWKEMIWVAHLFEHQQYSAFST